MDASRSIESGPSRRLSRTITAGNFPDFMDPEVVPSSLAKIAPILRVANEIEEEAPRVAYLCRFYAFDMAHRADMSSSGRGVRQFKTALLHKLEKDDKPTQKQRSAKSDAREMQNYYQDFFDRYVKSLENAGDNMDRPRLAKAYQTAAVLFDVLKAVNQQGENNEPVDPEVEQKAELVKSQKDIVGAYNILPLDPGASKQAIRMLPEEGNFLAFIDVQVVEAIVHMGEVDAALKALQNIRGLEFPSSGEQKKAEETRDMLDWLQLNFGFQKDNVANQRENLILLLANVHIRQKPKPDPENKLSDKALESVMKRLFKNYKSWCKFLHRETFIKLPNIQQAKEQRSILYVGLFLLIWGEAANLRFMPESLCYIFHYMVRELNGMLDGKVSSVTGENVKPAYGGDSNAFLDKVITPIYKVIAAEGSHNKDGRARHSAWRNYDDLNEFFWSANCFNLGWPMNIEKGFFRAPEETARARGSWIGKCNFVEERSFWHIFRSFDRMWSFFILCLQIMVIVAWNGSGSLGDIFHGPIMSKVLSVFITAAILRLIQAIIDIGMSYKSWRNMNFTGIFRYILKVIVALGWVIILPVCYTRTWGAPIELLKTFENWFGKSESPKLYVAAIFLYLVPDALGVIIFFVPSLRRSLEQADNFVVKMLLWWALPPLYIGRGMHENSFSLFKYTLFWVLLLLSKLLFSYYVEVLPLIAPTKEIIQAPLEENYQWHEFFPNAKNNWGVVLAVWSPIILVYFMDAQIWYAVWSTIFGGIAGAFSRLGEIRNQEMLRSRFRSLPAAFEHKLIPSEDRPRRKVFSLFDKHSNTEASQPDKEVFAKFSQLWNEIIESLREEDYLSNHEKELLLIPYSRDSSTYHQWPAFLLANKIALALDTAKDFTENNEDDELIRRFSSDGFMKYAIKECYDLFIVILCDIMTGDREKKVINSVILDVQSALNGKFLKTFRLSAMPLLYEKIVDLVEILKDADPNKKERVTYLLQDIYEVYIKDVAINKTDLMKDLSDSSHGAHINSNRGQTDNVSLNNTRQELFGSANIQYPLSNELKQKIERVHLLLTIRESAMDVPTNVEARRRIAFFTNSLFMDMPPPPKIRNMLSFSVLTPYYTEEILYTRKALEEENEDGVSILYYLQKIYPDDWRNFMERTKFTESNMGDTETFNAVRQWASYRAQSLSRTVRGMMYYRRALKLQAFFDMAESSEIMQGYNEAMKAASNEKSQTSLSSNIEAIADMKFTYVVTCQKYGFQKRTQDPRANDIFNLMKEHPSLRVAYIDEVEIKNGKEKEYYSKLVKVIVDKDDKNATEQEIYNIKLPGNPIIGEGKPENQNHAIIFTRGEALQAIDMNQDNYLEEALKMRNLLEEFLNEGGRPPSILGMREHIFTGSVSSLAGFMSNQESSFVTIGQRVLANPLKVRFHYGHPDVFERLFHISRGGISKASKGVNLSEDIFAGFNTTLRRGLVTHHEYIQVGKGRDVGLNQISLFEAKIANGNGEQTMSRDVYRLGHRMDFFRMLSVYFTTVGFYFNTLIVVLTVYVFLYGRIYLALSGLEASLNHFAGLENNTSLQAALASQSFVQIGLLMALPMVMEMGLEQGFRKALSEFIIMQLQLASVFFTFSMGTKVHFYGRTLLHGGAKYRPTGRGFVVFHAKFAENYRLYSRSHFTKGLELLILLIVYNLYGLTVHKTVPYLLITFSLWFLVGTWLYSPFLFNPSGFEWQKIVEDWDDWNKWVSNRGGIGVPSDKSWESWWDEEQSHLNTSGLRGQIIEILLSTRFLLYQYGLVYHLNLAHHNKSILVYALSWLVIVFLLALFKVVSEGRRRFSAEFQLFFRLLKGGLFLAAVAILVVLFTVGQLIIPDLFISLIAFLPSGWAIIQISQACRPVVKKVGLWESVKALARGYEYLMGLVLFMPIAMLAWFPFISDFQTRLLFNQAFSRGLQISRILAGRKDKKSN